MLGVNNVPHMNYSNIDDLKGKGSNIDDLKGKGSNISSMFKQEKYVVSLFVPVRA